MIDPVSGTDRVCDVLVESGRIVSIGASIGAGAEEVIDAAGLIVSPGLIDPHVHLREPGQEHKETS